MTGIQAILVKLFAIIGLVFGIIFIAYVAYLNWLEQSHKISEFSFTTLSEQNNNEKSHYINFVLQSEENFTGALFYNNGKCFLRKCEAKKCKDGKYRLSLSTYIFKGQIANFTLAATAPFHIEEEIPTEVAEGHWWEPLFMLFQ